MRSITLFKLVPNVDAWFMVAVERNHQVDQHGPPIIAKLDRLNAKLLKGHGWSWFLTWPNSSSLRLAMSCLSIPGSKQSGYGGTRWGFKLVPDVDPRWSFRSSCRGVQGLVEVGRQQRLWDCRLVSRELQGLSGCSYARILRSVLQQQCG